MSLVWVNIVSHDTCTTRHTVQSSVVKYEFLSRVQMFIQIVMDIIYFDLCLILLPAHTHTHTAKWSRLIFIKFFLLFSNYIIQITFLYFTVKIFLFLLYTILGFKTHTHTELDYTIRRKSVHLHKCEQVGLWCT